MGRLNKTDKILKQLKSKPESKTPIATSGNGADYLLPNYSVVKGTTHGYTAGSVMYWDKGFAQDNDNLYWDCTNKRLGIGTTTPAEAVHIQGNTLIGNLDGLTEIYPNFISQNNLVVEIGEKTASAGPVPLPVLLLTRNQTDTTDGLVSSITSANLAKVGDQKRLSAIVTYTHGAVDRGQMHFYTGRGGYICRAITIDSNQKVGIGTKTPARKLHIYDANDPCLLRIECASGVGNKYATFELKNDAGKRGFITTYSSSYASNIFGTCRANSTVLYSNEETLMLGTIQVKPVIMGVGNAEKMRIHTNGNIGIGTTTPATSAKLEVASTTGALLLPRMTTAQRNALTAVNGMMIYNSTTNAFNFYENGAWVTGSGLV